MLTFGMMIVLVGYGLAYTGKQMWNGCSPNIIDVFWPGKYTPCKSTATAPGNPANAGGPAPGTTTNPILPNGQPASSLVKLAPGGGLGRAF